MSTEGARLKNAFLGLIAVFLVSGSLWGLGNTAVLRWLFIHASYYILLTMTGVWLFHLIRYAKAHQFLPTRFFVTNWHLLLAAAVLTGVIFLSTPVDFKTLNDESVLLSVSQSLLYFRTPLEISDNMNYWGSCTPLTTAIPIRPLLFPFVLQLLHQILGYHHYNAFILNAVFLFLLLCGIGIWLKKRSDLATSCASLFLCLSHPVIAVYATGGGYDLMTAVFFCLVMALLYAFINHPTNERLGLLWMTLVLLANIRHESCIYLVVVGVFCLSRLTREQFNRNLWLFLGTGLFMLPYLWQRLLVAGRYENPAGTGLFSLKMFFRNSNELIANLLNLDFYLPFSGLLNAVAVVVVCLLTFHWMARKLRPTPEQKSFVMLFLICLMANLIIILSHHAGTYSHPTQARFFILFSLATAAAPILLARVYPKFVGSGFLLGFSIVVFLVHHPISMDNRFISTLMENRSYQAERNYLLQQKYENPLIITKYPVQFSSLGYSAMAFGYANAHKEKIMADLETHFYDGIVIFQQKLIETQLPLKGQRLNWRLPSENVARTAIYYEKVYLNISCVENTP